MGVGIVVELLDGAQHPLAAGLRDVAGLVDDPRDGGGGDARELRHVSQTALRARAAFAPASAGGGLGCHGNTRREHTVQPPALSIWAAPSIPLDAGPISRLLTTRGSSGYSLRIRFSRVTAARTPSNIGRQRGCKRLQTFPARSDRREGGHDEPGRFAPAVQPAPRRVGARAPRAAWSGPGRARRRAPPARSSPRYDPGCYLCPGNVARERRAQPRLRRHLRLRQRLPRPGRGRGGAVLPAGDDACCAREPESGVCRVLCFSPRHDLTLARMAPPEIRARGRRLGRGSRARWAPGRGSATSRSSRTRAR